MTLGTCLHGLIHTLFKVEVVKIGAVLEVYLISHFQLSVEYLLADGDLKGFLELLYCLDADDLQHLLEVDLIEGCLNGVDVNRGLSFGLEYHFFLSKHSKGRD